MRDLLRRLLRPTYRPSLADLAWERAVASAQRAVQAADRAAEVAGLRPTRVLSGPELVLAVARIFPHEYGQQLWWESYNRRSPRLREELVADLQRRLDRDAAGA